MTSKEPRIISDISEISEKIAFARQNEKQPGRVVFLIGAGCSISAGIPDAKKIAKRMVRTVAQRFNCCNDGADNVQVYNNLVARKHFQRFATVSEETMLTDETIDWYKVYDKMFDRHYTAPDDVRDLRRTC